MPNTFSAEATSYLNTVPAAMANGGVSGGRVRRWRATITLAAQADGDTVTLFKVPAGMTFCYGVLLGSATLGTSTIAIGVSGYGRQIPRCRYAYGDGRNPVRHLLGCR
jgi:hypothetical protein